MAASWSIVVVRAWVDSGIVKARLVSSDGLSASAGSLEETLGLLSEWLGVLARQGPGHGGEADGPGDAPVTPE